MTVRVEQADLASPDDAQAVLRLLDSYARDPMGDGKGLPPDVQQRLIPGLRACPATVVFLARDGAEPIGVAVCFEGFSTFAGRPLINIHDLAVLPEQRGRGAGRALLAAVENYARQHRHCRITLEVRSDNRRAQQLYRSFGFEPSEGAACHYFWKKPLEVKVTGKRET